MPCFVKRFVAIVVVVFFVAAGAVAQQRVYEANWESLNARPTPEWFEEARFGIFIHWGVYSVPAWSGKGTYAEWYWQWMNDPANPVHAFHRRTYGADFKYQAFAPRFKAELFDPQAWANLFERAGAKYVVLTSKHHDGYCLWPSAQSWNWNSVDVGPGRDLCGDLAEAVRETDMKMGFYYSLYEWYHPLYLADPQRYVAEHMMPQFKDLVTRYQPSVIFADGEWEHPDTLWRSTELLAWLYNEAGIDDVVVNDRWGKDLRSKCGDYYTTEYGKYAQKEMSGAHAWEENRGIGGSYGFNRNEDVEDYRTGGELIRLLVDTASRGGNLLLNVGPTGDGRIPAIMQDRLLHIGRWLKVNGQSIYGTQAGPFGELVWGRSTQREGKVYLHVYERPADGVLVLPPLKNLVSRAYLLADPGVAVRLDATDGLMVYLPQVMPDADVSVVVLELEGAVERDSAVRPDGQGDVILMAGEAAIAGEGRARFDEQAGAIVDWTGAGRVVRWEFVVPHNGGVGEYHVQLEYACEEDQAGSGVVLFIDSQSWTGQVRSTGGADRYARNTLGKVTLGPGRHVAAVRAVTTPRGGREGVMRLRAVRLEAVR